MNVKLFFHVFALLAMTFTTTTMTAQQKQAPALEDLMWGGKNYWSLQPENYYGAWWGDRLVKLGVESVQLCSNEKGKLTKPQVLFSVEDIRPLIADSTEGRGLNLLASSFPDGKKTEVLLATSRTRFIYDWKAKKIVWKMARERATQHHEFNVASRSEAYTKDWNLYLKTADGREHRISTDGSRQIPYGTSVHRDEFGIHKGTFFSPKGNLLAFYRMDQSMVADYPLVDIFQREAVEAPEKYPMAGMTSHKVTVGVYNPATEKTVYLQAGDPTDRYFSGISWAPDEKTIYLIEMPRSQKEYALVAYDAETGARKSVLYTEKHEKYVHPENGITFLPWDSSKFLLQSQRDGFNHLYLFDVDGREIKQLTKGDFVVLEIAGFNAKSRNVIVKTTESGHIRNNYYAVNVETGARTLLDNGAGVHRASLSAGGQFLLDRWSEPNVFRKVALRSTTRPSETLLQECESPWTRFTMPEVKGGTLTAADGKTPLHYRLVLPVGFDPAKKYPAVVYVYGGPGIRNVEESYDYSARPWEYYMANKGYVLFVLDNRGSSDRGFAFESATYKHLGREEMKDQLKGVDFLKKLPYVDADRLGVHGWSFGGFMTTSLMCTYPDVFKVGVAGGPVIDWKYYEVMYGERYMSTPQENPEGYEDSSLLPKAKNLKGRLQVIFGYNDPTCVPQHTLSFMSACIEAGTQPDLFTYPGQGHNMAGHDMVHLHDRITRYFEDFLK